jgi:hypothetical protein
MPFTWKERRALREIEEHLAAEDPALAGLLRATGTARPDWLLRRVRRWVVTAALTLVVLGVILDSGGLVVGGFLMLSTLPVLLAMVWHRGRCAADSHAAHRSWSRRSSSPAPHVGRDEPNARHPQQRRIQHTASALLDERLPVRAPAVLPRSRPQQIP